MHVHAEGSSAAKGSGLLDSVNTWKFVIEKQGNRLQVSDFLRKREQGVKWDRCIYIDKGGLHIKSICNIINTDCCLLSRAYIIGMMHELRMVRLVL